MGWPESRGMIRRAIQLSLSVVALLAATRAPGQWVHFQDRTSGSLVVAPGGDDREKDCGLGDFDRDGWQDIVVVRKVPFKDPGGEPDLLLMNEEGVLTDRTAELAPEFLTRLTDARDVFVTDIDGDGWPDLILANTFGDQPVCYRNQGEDPASGEWLGFADESAQRLPHVDVPDLQFCAVCARDITGDGAPDLYFSNYVRAPDIALDLLLINDGDGFFSDESDARLGSLRQSAFGTSVDLRDVDADGDRDIIKTSSLNAAPPWDEIGVFILFNDGNGEFDSFQPVPTESPYMFAIEDLNDDDLLDFYIVNDSQDYAVLNAGVDPASPHPVQFEKTVLDGSPRTYFLGGNLQFVDLDGDGDRDVAIADVDIDIGICDTAEDDPRKFALLRNEGQASGSLVDPFGLETNPWNTNVFDLAAFDIDRDGDVDLFLAGCDGYLVMMQEPTLHVSAERLVFTDITAGASEQQVLRVCNNGPDPVEVTEIAVGGAAFSVSQPALSLSPYECRDLQVSFAPRAPGSYGAELSLVAGDLSRVVTLSGTSVTPPELVIEAAPLDFVMASGEGAVRSLRVANAGGSDLRIDVRMRIPELPPDRVLLMGSELVLPLLEGSLQALPNEYQTAAIDTASAASFDGFDTLVVGVTGGEIGADFMGLLTAAVEAGKTLIILGASTDPDFLDGLQAALLNHDDVPGWTEPAEPHFQIADPNHPLVDDLSVAHSFTSPSASWYRIRPDDPDAWVAAVNGDGIPCLLSKRVGRGQLIYFTNWPLQFVWEAPVDRAIFERIIANAIGSAQLAWLSADPRSRVLGAGEMLSLNLTINTLGQVPGSYRAEIVVTSDDAARPEVVIPISLEIATPGPEMASLELQSVDGSRVTLSLSGEAGATYEIQRSSDLRRWERASEVVVSGMPVAVEDVLPQTGSRIYYRAERLTVLPR